MLKKDLSNKKMNFIETRSILIGENWETPCRAKMEGHRVRVYTWIDNGEKEISELYDIQALNNVYITIESMGGDVNYLA